MSNSPKPDAIALTGNRVITPHRIISDGYVYIESGKITQVGRGPLLPKEGIQILDFPGKMIVPGFVEVHIHGYAGIMVGSPENSPNSSGDIADDIRQVSSTLTATGITSFLPTFLAADGLPAILSTLKQAAETVEYRQCGAEILGFHMEGPFFNTALPGTWDRYPPGGAIPSKFARPPSVDELHQIIQASGDNLRMMSLSPEILGAIPIIRELVACNAVASGAHSFASFSEFESAVDAGMTTVTHMYNGMRHQAHREPGIIEAALVDDRVTVQLIADGVHVHTPALEIAFRCKGPREIAITTDNTPWAGLPDGEYRDSHGRELRKSFDRVELTGGPLYGSVMPMNKQLENLVNKLNLLLEQGISMATIIPARLIGVEDRKGSLEPGKDADIVVLDNMFNVEMTLCKGHIEFSI